MLLLSFSHRRLVSMGLLSLLFAMAPLGGWCHRHQYFGVHPEDILLDSMNENIDTEQVLQKLSERRRLQLDAMEIQADLTSPLADEIDLSVTVNGNTSPANGCSICQGTTLLSNKVPNQIFKPEFEDATCQEWQDTILPSFFPDGKDCRNHIAYQMFFVMCCQLPLARHQCEENIHEDISSRDVNTGVPPIVDQERPLTVSTDIVYNWVEEIDVRKAEVTVHLTIYLKWNDPRLAWTVNDTNCADYVSLGTDYGGKTSLWIPDFGLLNGNEHFRDSPTRDAIVFSDGTVHWQTGGRTTATCQFQGLANIPYDELGCQFIYGHRSRADGNAIFFKHASYNRIKIAKFDVQYSEYRPLVDMFEKGYTWYLNSDYSSALYFNFYFRRSQNFYLVNILVPTIIFTYCSFFTFLLDMRIGERLGYAMALALVIVAHQIVTVGMIPVSNRTLWINRFIAWSFYWVLVALVQSVFVGFIYFLNQDFDAKQERNRESAIQTPGDGSDDDSDNGSQCSQGSDASSISGSDKESPPEAAIPTSGDKDAKDSERPANQPTDETCPGKPMKKPFYFKFSTRKFDFLCLAICLFTYTIFLIAMFASVRTEKWVQGEASWDNYESQYYVVQFENQVFDPLWAGSKK